MNTLYLVATPIGNLEDITLRALRVLREVALIAAEDTRHAKRLLAHYEIRTPCLSYHEHNKHARQGAILEALGTGDVALVSDAGTPALSDPGYELVTACIAAGIPVVPVPGPSAPIAALVVSGLPIERFTYLGFLPRRSSERRALFAEVLPLPATLVCFETPHRLVAALTDALAVFGERHIAVARELTKLHEEVVRGNIGEVLEHFTHTPPRGECTLVIAGQPADAHDDAPPSEAMLLQRMQHLHDAGHSTSRAARLVAQETGVPKSDLYDLWLRSASNE